MKVICINTGTILNKDGTAYDAPELIEGRDYTATQCGFYPDCYVLSGHEYDPIDGRPVSYLQSRFAPLSDIDETETEAYKQRQLQTA